MTWGMIGGAAISVVGGAVLGGSGQSQQSQQQGVSNALQYTKEAAGKAKNVLNPIITMGDKALTGVQTDIGTYRGAGTTGINLLKQQTGDVNVSKYLDPSMKFALDTGTRAIQGSASAKGLLHSGATLKELMKYGTGLASENWQSAFTNSQNDAIRKSNVGGTLSNIGTIGTQTGASLVGQGNIARTNEAGIETGQGVDASNLAMSSGNIAAAGSAAQQGQYQPLIKAAADGFSNWMKTPSTPTMAQMGQDLYGTGGDYADFSDEQLKEHITTASKTAVEEFMNSINPKEYQYTAEGQQLSGQKGRKTGFIAQDVERSKIGKQIIQTDPQSGFKEADIPKTVSALMASVAVLNDKVNKLGKK